MRDLIDRNTLILIVQLVQITCWFAVGLIARELGNDIANLWTSTAAPYDRFDVRSSQATG